MTPHERYRAMLKELKLTPAMASKIVGVTMGSYYVLMRKDVLPKWAKTMLWIYENKSREIAIKQLKSL